MKINEDKRMMIVSSAVAFQRRVEQEERDIIFELAEILHLTEETVRKVWDESL